MPAMIDGTPSTMLVTARIAVATRPGAAELRQVDRAEEAERQADDGRAEGDQEVPTMQLAMPSPGDRGPAAAAW